MLYRGRKEILPDLPDDIPIPGRYSSAVFLRDPRGWYYIYSHTHPLDEAIVPGRHIKMGQTWRPKTRKNRRIPISKALRQYLDAYERPATAPVLDSTGAASAYQT